MSKRIALHFADGNVITDIVEIAVTISNHPAYDWLARNAPFHDAVTMHDRIHVTYNVTVQSGTQFDIALRVRDVRELPVLTEEIMSGEEL